MRIFILLITLLSFQRDIAQSVGIGTSTPDPSARLQISSSTQGFLLPTLSAAQRSAINNPATGLLVFQTDGTAGFYYYGGSGWVNLTTGHSPNNQGTALSRHYGFTTTLAGSIGDYENGQGEDASFNRPTGMAIDAAGNLYVADQFNHAIRMITPTGMVSTFAGTGTAGKNNGPKASATFDNPHDLALDAFGNMYVADRGNHLIRKIAANGQVTTVAGSEAGFADDRGELAKFNLPAGIAIDAAGNIYVADQGNSRIRKIDPDGNVSTLAGRGHCGDFDGTGNNAIFCGPTDVALDAAGNIIVADQANNKIRMVTPEGHVSTIAGKGLAQPGSQDGVGTEASFNVPWGVTVDLYGNIYVADRRNNKIRKITPSGVVSTLAGTGSIGAYNGARVVVSFNNPFYVATDAFGDVYVADHFNHRIRKIITQ